MGLTAYEHVRTEQSTFDTDRDTPTEIVPFGIYHVDAALIMGVKPLSPQLNVIQGGSGSRKTTLMFNIIMNMCLSGLLPEGHKIVYDIQENGFTIERCGLVLRCMLATKYIIYQHFSGFRGIQVDENPVCYLRELFRREIELSDPAFMINSITFSHSGRQVPECVLSPDFIEAYYLNKVHMTPLQTKAWLIAGDALQQFPIEFFGVSEHPNWEIAERRSIVTTNIEESYERWCAISDGCESIQVVTDYLQEYWLPSGSQEHYQKQLIVTPWLSRFIKEKRKTLWCISQEGIQHQRDFQSKGVVLGSSGGDVLKSASQNNWRVSYNGATSPYYMVLHSPVKSRRGSHPDLRLRIEPKSGVIFGRSEIMER